MWCGDGDVTIIKKGGRMISRRLFIYSCHFVERFLLQQQAVKNH